MEYDFYNLYLGTDYDNYVERIKCDDLEEISIQLNNADLYEKYLVIGINIKEDLQVPLMKGRIEPNRKKTNKTKKLVRKKII